MEAKVAGQQDIEPAKSTYSNFIALFKWGSVVVAISTLIIVLIIAGRAG